MATKKKTAAKKETVNQPTEEFDTLTETPSEETPVEEPTPEETPSEEPTPDETPTEEPTPEPVAQRQSFRADVQPDNQVEHHLKQEAERAEARRLHQAKTEGRFDAVIND